MILKVYRFDKANKSPHFDSYDLEPVAGMTTLGALFHIQDEIDPTLSFRYSCRGAVCGTCAMLINKVPRLACRTQLSSLLGQEETIDLKPYSAITEGETFDRDKEIIIEPLPHLPVLKDLIVDMDRFFKYYRTIEPVFKPKDETPDKERLLDPSDVKELEKLTNCVLCAACFGACPVNGESPEYLGPAALAKLYRFHIDPREASDGSRLLLANSANGFWGCDFHTNCKKVCPKDVPPNYAIGQARNQLKKSGNALK